MRPNPSHRGAPHRIDPALTSLADDCARTMLGLVLYVGALALIAIVIAIAAGPLTEAAITAATETATSRFDLAGNTDGPEILRPPAAGHGGRAGAQSLGLRGAF